MVSNYHRRKQKDIHVPHNFEHFKINEFKGLEARFREHLKVELKGFAGDNVVTV